MKFVAVLLSLLIAGAVQAQVGAKLPSVSMRNAGGSLLTFTNCTVTAVEPDGLRVMHDAGFAKLPFEALPPEMQRALGFDAAKVEQFREEKRQAEARAAAAMREAEAARLAKEEAAKQKATTAAASLPSPPAPPQATPVSLTGDVLPMHRTKDYRMFLMRLHRGGQLVRVSGMSATTDRNGGIVTITAYPTGQTELFENQTVLIYSVDPPKR